MIIVDITFAVLWEKQRKGNGVDTVFLTKGRSVPNNYLIVLSERFLTFCNGHLEINEIVTIFYFLTA